MSDRIIKLPDVGATIYYKMRTSDSPIEPDREWRGKVIKTGRGILALLHVLTQACERGTLRQTCVQAVICMDQEAEVAAVIAMKGSCNEVERQWLEPPWS